MASLREYEKRIEKLEEAYGPSEVMVLMRTFYGVGEVKGWKGDNGFYVKRNPGESEEALASRAAEEARTYYRDKPPPPWCIVMLLMDKEPETYVKPEPALAAEPERIPETAPEIVHVPPPLIADKVEVKPLVHFRTIREIQSEYADRRHWMA